MLTEDSIFPNVGCQCFSLAYLETGTCNCCRNERYLRRCQAGSAPLTPEQRRWCVAEAAREGRYNEVDLAAMDDASLAASVLDAWSAYLYAPTPAPSGSTERSE